jgi:hypothetical protein
MGTICQRGCRCGKHTAQNKPRPRLVITDEWRTDLHQRYPATGYDTIDLYVHMTDDILFGLLDAIGNATIAYHAGVRLPAMSQRFYDNQRRIDDILHGRTPRTEGGEQDAV